MVDTRLLREVVALVAIVAGVTTVVVAAFLAHRIAGVAALGVVMIVTGVALGLDRNRETPSPYDR